MNVKPGARQAAFENPEVATLLDAAMFDRELSKIDSTRLSFGVRYMCRVWENAYHQYRDNLFDEGDWESHKHNIQFWYSLPAFREVIADERFLNTLESEFVEEFRKTVAV